MLQYIKDYYSYLVDWFYKNDDNIVINDIKIEDIKSSKLKLCIENNAKFDNYVEELKYVLEQRKNK